MAWPREIAHGGRGANRMSNSEDSKRRFLRDAVLIMLQKSDLKTDMNRADLQAMVEVANDLHNMIEKKL